MVSWIAAIATGCSGNLSVPLNAFTMVTLLHLDSIDRRWMDFVALQVINILTCFGAYFSNILC